MNRLVSVIIPVYNSSEYISEAITSVLSQTYNKLEIIVIDDGSTDTTEETVKKIRDNRIRYIKSEKQGNYFARNMGIRKASGEYIAFLDADDIWLKDKLKKQVDVFNKDNDVGLCCTDHYIFFDGKKSDTYADTLHSFSRDLLSHTKFIERLLIENIIITSSVVVRKSCFEHLGVFDTAYQNAMDYDMWLRIILNYKAYYIKDRYLLKRRHVLNISKNKVNTLNALLYIFTKVKSCINGTKFFDVRHEELVDKKMRKTMYDLGLEYLSARDYKNAFQYLRDSKATEKNVFRYFAMSVAKLHAGFLAALIDLYRSQRQKSKIVHRKL
ncbi:MAG: glycosyltransferase [Candidatus Aureabacteria bacterium]|nr:glycosyltransferase [Candidatus Auribacterota bacterium]